jgi:hypothetical protein
LGRIAGLPLARGVIMKMAALGLILVGVVTANHAAFAQASNETQAACLERIKNNGRSKTWQTTYCDCSRATRGGYFSSIQACMLDLRNASREHHHGAGFHLIYCTETTKRSDRPDSYYIFKNKFFLNYSLPGEPDSALDCTEFESCQKVPLLERSGEKKIVLYGHTAEREEYLTLNPPYHRSVSRAQGVTTTTEGPCQIFGNYDVDWPDHGFEPMNLATALVCTQAGGPSYCVPGQYGLQDAAFNDKARIDREEFDKASTQLTRAHDMLAACNDGYKGQAADKIINTYCMCMNVKKKSSPDSIMDWGRTHPETRAECERVSHWK